MSTITIKTQAELDKLPDSFKEFTWIEIRSKAGTWIKVSKPYENAVVRAFDSSQVLAFDSSQVEAYHSSQVQAFGSSQVKAFGSSQVVAWDSSQVWAHHFSKIEAYDSSQVFIQDEYTNPDQKTLAYDNAIVHSKDVRKIILARAHGNTSRNKLSDSA